MTYEFYKQQLNSLNLDIVIDITATLRKENAVEIEFHTPMLHAYINDQANEVIARLNIQDKVVLIDSGTYIYRLALDRLTLDELLGILGEVESGNYEVWEEVEN